MLASRGQRLAFTRSRAVQVRVRDDTDTSIGIGIGDTGISLPAPIPIRGIADMTILKKDNYYAFATTEVILTPYYLEVTEHTKHYLHIMSMFVLRWCYACIIAHCDQYDEPFLRNKGKTLFCCVAV